MGSLHEAGDALVAVARFEEDGVTILGSGVMVAPGMLLTATHVLDEFPADGPGPVFLTFLPSAKRAWLPQDVRTISRPSIFDAERKISSDLSLVSCTLNSEAHAGLPLMLAPMQIALPLVGDRLWAMGFRHQGIDKQAALVTPLVSSGLVTAAFPMGRGERMVSPCFEVAMETVGGMSGGAVVNDKGYLVGILSSSFEGGPSYVTLIWDAIRMRVRGSVPRLQVNDTVSVMGANEWGLAKIKGSVERDPFGDVRIALSDDEMALFTTSLSRAEWTEVKTSALNREQLEDFEENWGRELEEAAVEIVLQTLNGLPVSRIQEFLEDSDIPEDLLTAIEGFSVEDFDGLEDISITSTEAIDETRFRLDYYFDIPSLIWTVEMDAGFADAHASSLDVRFFNRRVENGIARMEMAQRRYFRGSAIFHRDAEIFTDATITLSAIKPRRKA
ncbi:trypsin-like serine peptidase [Nitrobacter hamburgensis]|nr:serine protease [Nitrobacter hamburgensis]